MAQVVGYFDDNVTFTEGPFVIVPIYGWRIEVEMKGHHCPVHVDTDVWLHVSKNLGYKCNKYDRLTATEICDWLNNEVKEGRITLQDKKWRVA
jgi:hypothetical protein